MAKYVPDSNTERWVIIAPGRTGRPKTHGSGEKPVCPFCAGNEAQTPPETYRIGPGEKDTAGWLVRVVPNKYPITDIHEVIIHSPDDVRDIEKLPLDQVIRVLTAYRDRFRAHQANGHVLIFCNHGFHSGASLAHPHSQLAVIPKQINLDTIAREPITNVIEESTHFTIYCPDFSQWPYEVWLAPNAQATKFGDITAPELTELAAVLQKTLQKLEKISLDPPAGFPRMDAFTYNYYIYHLENWYLRIVPRFIHRAGFELGTGLSVNVTDPMEAARILREMKIP